MKCCWTFYPTSAISAAFAAVFHEIKLANVTQSDVLNQLKYSRCNLNPDNTTESHIISFNDGQDIALKGQ